MLRYPAFYCSLLPTCCSHLWVSSRDVLLESAAWIWLICSIWNKLFWWPIAGLEGDIGCFLHFSTWRHKFGCLCHWVIGFSDKFLRALCLCHLFILIQSGWNQLGLETEWEQKSNFSLKWVRVGMLVQATAKNKKLAHPKLSTHDTAGTGTERGDKKQAQNIILCLFSPFSK